MQIETKSCQGQINAEPNGREGQPRGRPVKESRTQAKSDQRRGGDAERYQKIEGEKRVPQSLSNKGEPLSLRKANANKGQRPQGGRGKK
jgi:hypothetical protein